MRWRMLKREITPDPAAGTPVPPSIEGPAPATSEPGPGLIASRSWAIPLIVFLIAFSFRLLYLLQLRSSPYFDVPLVDAETYFQTAQGLLQGKGYDVQPFWQAPLYPTVLALLLKMGKGSLFAVRFFQIILGSLSCVLVYFIGTALFTRRVAFLASLISACYGILIYFDCELLAPPLLVFLSLLSFFTGLRAQSSGRPLLWGASGVLLGLSGITWGSTLLFAPVLFFWAYRSRVGPKHRYRALGRLLGVLVGLSISILPVTLYNGFKGDDWVLISANSGVNFYIGNNEHMDETLGIRPGYPWLKLMRRPWGEAGVRLSSEQSSFFFRKSLAFCVDKPHLFVGNLFVKFYRFWNAAEISRNVYLYDATQYSWILKTLLWPTRTFCFPFGLLSPVALLGLILARRERKTVYPALGFIVAVTFAVVLFFVTARYRTPLLPFLALFGAYAVYRVVDFWKEGRLRNFGKAVGVLVVLLVLCNLPFLRPANPDSAEIPYWAAVTVFNRGDHARSARFCKRALEANGRFHPAMVKLGEIAHQQGDLETARSWLEQAVAIAPQSPEAYSLLGIVLSARRDRGGALTAHQRAVELDPLNDNHHFNLGFLLISFGRLDEAMDSLSAAARLAKNQQSSHARIVAGVNGMAESIIRGGGAESALVLLEWAHDLVPQGPRTVRNLVVARIASKHDPRLFVEDMKTFIRLAPEDAMVPQLRILLDAIEEDVP